MKRLSYTKGEPLALPEFARGDFTGVWAHAVRICPEQSVQFVMRGDGDDRMARPYRITWAALDIWSNQMAHALRARGIAAGDRVALMLPHVAAYWVSFLGALKAGAAVVPINVMYAPEEMASQLRAAGARALILLDEYRADWESVRSQAGTVEVVWTASRYAFVSDTRQDLSHLLSEFPITAATTAPQSTDLALLPFTGGTTGLSKGVALTHAQLIAVIYQSAQWLRHGPPVGTLLTPLPTFHSYGIGVVLTGICEGKEILAVPNLSGPHRFIDIVYEAIQDHRPDAVFGVPTIFKGLLERAARENTRFEGLRWALSRGAKLPAAVQSELTARGMPLIEGYGLTEASSNLTTPIGRPKAGSVGRPMAGVEAQIVHQETRRRRPIGKRGELLVRGPNVMRGYWNQPEGTPDALQADGWLRTGDIAEMDAEGYVTITGRRKEMIITGGENVYPSDVEGVLHRHPSVADVAVVGVPDAQWGERVVAFIVLRNGTQVTEEEIIIFARQHLARFKIPKRVVLVPELPKTPLGKVQKGKLIKIQLGRE